MDLSGLQKKLIAAARNNPPADTVPYAFEKRIMALLSRAPMDVWGIWARGLTRAAVCCVAAVMVIGTVTYLLPPKQPDNLSQDVESTLLAAVDNSAADAASESE
jgi:hypothetical protein